MTKTPNPAARSIWKARKRTANAARGTQVWLGMGRGWGDRDTTGDSTPLRQSEHKEHKA